MAEIKSNSFRLENPDNKFEIIFKASKSYEDSYLFKIENKDLKHKVMCKVHRKPADLSLIEMRDGQKVQEIFLRHPLTPGETCTFWISLSKHIEIVFGEKQKILIRSIKIPMNEHTLLFKPAQSTLGTGIDILRFDPQ